MLRNLFDFFAFRSKMQIPLIELSPVNTTTPRKTNSPLYILDH